jgi:putative phosphoribosyl transferase
LVFDRASKLSGFISGLKDGSSFQLQLKDRVSAGKVLAMVLKTVVKRKKNENDLLVLGIPRGGVIVADIVAEKLNADYFDIVIPRKLRAPDNKENAIGAIAGPDGSTMYLDEFMVSSLKVPTEYIEKEKAEQREEIQRRTELYRRHVSSLTMSQQPPPDETEDDYPITADKTSILLIDDGIATGASAIAAARWLRTKYKPSRLIIAAPVASKQAIELIKKENVADMIETVTTPANFISVSQFYKDFDQATDDKVIEIVGKWKSKR